MVCWRYAVKNGEPLTPVMSWCVFLELYVQMTSAPITSSRRPALPMPALPTQVPVLLPMPVSQAG